MKKLLFLLFAWLAVKSQSMMVYAASSGIETEEAWWINGFGIICIVGIVVIIALIIKGITVARKKHLTDDE